MPYSDKTKTLNRLTALVEKRIALEVEVMQTVQMARQRDFDNVPMCSWAQVADALHVSKQAAWAKYGFIDALPGKDS